MYLGHTAPNQLEGEERFALFGVPTPSKPCQSLENHVL